MKKVCVFNIGSKVGVVNEDLKINIFEASAEKLVDVLIEDFTNDGKAIYATLATYGVLLMSDQLEKIKDWNYISVLCNVSVFNEDIIDGTNEMIYDRLARGSKLNDKHPMVIAIKHLILAEILHKAKIGSDEQSQFFMYAYELLNKYIENFDVITHNINKLREDYVKGELLPDNPKHYKFGKGKDSNE